MSLPCSCHTRVSLACPHRCSCVSLACPVTHTRVSLVCSCHIHVSLACQCHCTCMSLACPVTHTRVLSTCHIHVLSMPLSLHMRVLSVSLSHMHVLSVSVWLHTTSECLRGSTRVPGVFLACPCYCTRVPNVFTPVLTVFGFATRMCLAWLCGHTRGLSVSVLPHVCP